MPRSFDMATDYPAGVEQVYRALSDERYWQARLADSGADEATLERLVVSDDGIDVVTTQVLASHRLPGLVSQFHRGDLVIRREETWTPLNGSRAVADIVGSIAAAPVSLAGSAELSPEKDKARMAFHATVEVLVPLVGRKLEAFIGNQLVDLLTTEQRFTTGWIAGIH
ncbi:MAG: DUF2505 domain-containing protein [Mycobacterium sp.]|nr:DUF2505 domain-containing protein [Mycobacterium sp.]